MSKKDKKSLPEPAPAPTLAQLFRAQGFSVADKAPSAAPEEAPARAVSVEDCLKRRHKLHWRKEHKGRAGKTVTLVTGFQASPEELEALAKAFRKALGCGATVEDDALVLQGDQIERGRAWVQSQG